MTVGNRNLATASPHFALVLRHNMHHTIGHHIKLPDTACTAIPHHPRAPAHSGFSREGQTSEKKAKMPLEVGGHRVAGSRREPATRSGGDFVGGAASSRKHTFFGNPRKVSPLYVARSRREPATQSVGLQGQEKCSFLHCLALTMPTCPRRCARGAAPRATPLKICSPPGLTAMTMQRMSPPT